MTHHTDLPITESRHNAESRAALDLMTWAANEQDRYDQQVSREYKQQRQHQNRRLFARHKSVQRHPG
jgi:hypothetical protein